MASVSQTKDCGAQSDAESKVDQVNQIIAERTCNHPRRNLVVCIDGTAKRFSEENTHVVELYRHLVKDGELQSTYYLSGTMIKRLHDMAFASKFEEPVLQAYRWIIANYSPGDRIFLFGFSRGAYQIRTLAAMINKVGLLQRGNEEQIPFAYELYAAIPPPPLLLTIVRIFLPLSSFTTGIIAALTLNLHAAQILFSCAVVWIVIMEFFGAVILCERVFFNKKKVQKEAKEESVPRAKTFKKVFSRDAGVHFVGAWDTVASMGYVRSGDVPDTVDGEDNVCIFRHALAINERRVKFLPEYRSGGASDSEGKAVPGYPQLRRVREMWFWGTHSDIGGRHDLRVARDNDTDHLATDPSFRWMAREARSAGLLFDPKYLERELVQQSKSSLYEPAFKESLSSIWWILEYLPIRRYTYWEKSEETSRPHFGGVRVPVEGQETHSSLNDVKERDPLIERGIYGPFFDVEKFANCVDHVEAVSIPNSFCCDCYRPACDRSKSVQESGQATSAVDSMSMN